MAEQSLCKRKVGGSTPLPGSNLFIIIIHFLIYMRAAVTDIEVFKKFDTLLYRTHTQFYVYRYLLDESYNPLYKEFWYFWGTVLPTLQEAFLLNLSNIFDEDNRVLSVYKYLKHVKDKEVLAQIKSKFEERKNNLKILSVWRGNYFAHSNIRFLFNKDEMLKRFPFKLGDAEDLLDLVVNILNWSKKDLDRSDITDYKKFYKDTELLCKKDIELFLAPFFSEGQVDNSSQSAA